MSDDAPSEDATRNQLREFRRIVSNVVGELRSQEIRDTFAAVTLAEVVQQQLDALTGTGARLSRKARLTRVYEEFNASLTALMETSPEAFRPHDPAGDANTDPSG